MKIGVDIGGSHVAIGIVNKDKIINKTEVEISSNIIEIEEFITKYIVNYIEEAKKFFLGNVYVPNDLEEVIL